VDELNKLVSRGKDWVADLQRKEIRRTGISSLKVSYNKVFGYYIEVTKANLDSVPDDYIRKQTLVNSERFITHELKEEEARIIGAEERIKELEYRLFCELRQKVGEHIEELKKTADMIAKIDVISDLASVALTNKYIRPEINTENRFQVEEARHPVLESMLKDKEFVPNDIEMDDKDNRIHIITGSNMAGKSTFIRQTALLSVMAQAGSFVPAASASIGIVDKIFTRVGASDRIYQGMSTFMVEMLETANILNNATAESLIILDEVGRGTSTYDGVSIAWAVVEHIHERIKGAKALFATHYHELTELASLSRGIRNCHLAVQEYNEDIIFLYKVKPGSCDESFGIHVAKLAGMPSQVVSRAREILANLHEDSFSGGMQHRFGAESAAADKQPDLFDTQRKEDDLRAKLESADVNGMTPLEALQFLADLKKGAL
jgi:DNA mismatch repair protein MutS